MSGSSTPAGWYPDPENPGQQRYWDGSAWAAPTPSAPVADAPPQFPGYAVPPPPIGGFVPPTSGYTAPGTTQMGYGYTQSAGAEAAGFGPRLLTVIVDALIVGIPMGILTGILREASDGLGLVGNLLTLVVGVVYWAYFEGGPEGQTLGKKFLNIRTVDATTYQPGIGQGRAIGRYFAKYLSAIPCALGFFWMLWDAEKQTWHDKIVGTRVVKA